VRWSRGRRSVRTRSSLHVFGGRGRRCGELPLGSYLARREPSGRINRLTPDFVAAGRPDVSFDGQRMLFIGQRTRDDRPAVWEMNADGTGLRQIMAGSAPCSAAIYLSTIYTLDADGPVYNSRSAPGRGNWSRPARRARSLLRLSRHFSPAGWTGVDSSGSPTPRTVLRTPIC